MSAVFRKVHKLSSELSECKPLVAGALEGRTLYVFPTRYGVPADGKLTQRVVAGGEPPENEAYYGVCKGDEMQALETTFYPGKAAASEIESRVLRAFFWPYEKMDDGDAVEWGKLCEHDNARRDDPFEATRVVLTSTPGGGGGGGESAVIARRELQAGEVVALVSGVTGAIDASDARVLPPWGPTDRVFFLRDDPARAPAPEEGSGTDPADGASAGGRGLHSFTLELNLSNTRTRS